MKKIVLMIDELMSSFLSCMRPFIHICEWLGKQTVVTLHCA